MAAHWFGLISLLVTTAAGCAPRFIASSSSSSALPCTSYTATSSPDFTVNSTLDTSDAGLNGVCDVGGGVCTLRAAIEEANSIAGTQVIKIPSGTTVTLTAVIPITQNVQIYGGDMTTTIVNVNNVARGFTASNDINVEFDNLTIRDGNSAAQGGAFYMLGGLLTLKYMVFNSNNATGDGGAVYLGSNFGVLTPDLVASCSRFTSNSTGSAGGAIYHEGGTSEISDTEFSSNSSTAEGGAVWFQNVVANIQRALFSSNTGNSAGGLFQRDQTVTIRSSTFVGNTATANGGASIYTDNNSNLNLYNNTFANNTIVGAWGTFLRQNTAGVINWGNNIVWGNSGGLTCLLAGTMNSLGNNIIDDSTNCTVVASDIGTNPSLGALGANGGFTNTMSVTSGSSAYRYGSSTYCPSTDQRGYTRSNTCTVGAYEVQ